MREEDRIIYPNTKVSKARRKDRNRFVKENITDGSTETFESAHIKIF